MGKSALMIWLALGASTVTWAQAAPPANLDSLVTEALANNPQVRSARQGAAAARARIGQATAFAAPQVGVEFYQTPVSSFPNPIENGQETDYSVQQMLPFPGKRQAMERAARYGAAMSEQDIYTTERQIARDVRAAYYALYYARRNLEINTEAQKLLRELIDVTAKQYEVGRGKQADILRAQTELSMLTTENLRLVREIRVAEANLNTLLGRSPGAPFGNVPVVESNISASGVARLDSLALENRPELRGLEYGIRMNQAEVTVAEKEKLPDFMLRFAYKDMKMTQDFWSSMVAVTVPQAFWSWGGYNAKVRESRINVRKAREDYTSMRNTVLLEVQTAYATLQSNQAVVNYYRTTLIPQTEQTLQSTIAAYRTGTMDFQSVIDAARTLLQTRRDYQMAITSLMTSQADLEQAIGVDISRAAPKS